MRWYFTNIARNNGALRKCLGLFSHLYWTDRPPHSHLSSSRVPRRFNFLLMIQLAITVGGRKSGVTGPDRVAEPAAGHVSPANTPPETERSLPLARSTLLTREASALSAIDWPS